MGSRKTNSPAVKFLYGTGGGRALLKLVLDTRADRAAVWFLRSPWSRPVVGWYAARHRISLTRQQRREFASFREFFIRRDGKLAPDLTPGRLISPCDGWLSAYPVGEDSSFFIKGSHYRLGDLLGDGELAGRYRGGDCLIFRLEASDHHRYGYLDDGVQGENHFIPGTLHSVQEAACSAYPVYTLNRRMWTLLTTRHFGRVVQTEIGALVVGGIVPEQESGPFRKGADMGRFELSGSTIVQLFEPGRIRLLPHILRRLEAGEEVRVRRGMWIGGAGACHG